MRARKVVVWVWVCACNNSGEHCRQCCAASLSNKTTHFAWRLDSCRSNSILESKSYCGDDSESEALLGRHPRTPVERRHLEPLGRYRAICKLVIHFEGQIKEATGWCLIDRGTIATAGHCVYDDEYGCAVAIEAHIGYHGKNPDLRKSHEARMAASVAVHQRWYDNFDRANDLALIKLQTPFDEVSPLRWAECPMGGEKVEVGMAGYPSDIPGGAEGHFMYESKGPTDWDLAKDPMLVHRQDTFSGNSGSPIFYAGKDQELVVIALHVSSQKLRRPKTISDDSMTGKFYRVNKAVAIGHKGNSFDDLQQAIMSLGTTSLHMTRRFGVRGQTHTNRDHITFSQESL